jgi:uncharacterized protein
LPPWSKPIEVERLAEAQADVDFVVALAELAGLRSLRGGVTGSVSGRVHFARRQDLAVAQLSLHGSATLECQRCMQPMQVALDSTSELALIASEAQAQRVPEELEPVLAPGGRISIGELITEELLLSLPIVALHEGSGGCAGAPAPASGQGAGETHKPFAQLGKLLKR